MYVNGALVSNSAYTGAIRTLGMPLTIGTSWITGYIECYYKGLIANVQIYNASLSASEVQGLYAEGMGEPQHFCRT